MRAAAGSLPALEVAVRSRGAALTGKEDVGVHAKTHRATRIAPFKARGGEDAVEAFLLRLADHFTSSFECVTGGRWTAERYAWERIQSHGAEHDHAFVRSGKEVRTAMVVADGADRHVIAGLDGLRVLKTTGSGFEGYPRDRYTTLAETRERILATEVAARWRYGETSVDYDAAYADVVTHQGEPARAEHFSPPLPVKKGDELGRFEMGSTVILLFERGKVRWDASLTEGARVRMGARIGEGT